jgi:hypothetical protein
MSGEKQKGIALMRAGPQTEGKMDLFRCTKAFSEILSELQV